MVILGWGCFLFIFSKLGPHVNLVTRSRLCSKHTKASVSCHGLCLLTLLSRFTGQHHRAQSKPQLGTQGILESFPISLRGGALLEGALKPPPQRHSYQRDVGPLPAVSSQVPRRHMVKLEASVLCCEEELPQCGS